MECYENATPVMRHIIYWGFKAIAFLVKMHVEYKYIIMHLTCIALGLRKHCGCITSGIRKQICMQKSYIENGRHAFAYSCERVRMLTDRNKHYYELSDIVANILRKQDFFVTKF